MKEQNAIQPHENNLNYYVKNDDLEGLLHYLNNNFELVGRGSSRIVFALDEKTVLKMASNEAGVSQNITEIELSSKYDGFIAKVLYHQKDDLWIISERAIELKEKDFKRFFGIDFAKFTYVLYVSFLLKKNRKLSSKEINTYYALLEYIRENGYSYFFDELSDMCIENDIEVIDFIKKSSWGIVRRNGVKTPVLIDYGYDRDTYLSYYKK